MCGEDVHRHRRAGLGHSEERCWKRPKGVKSHSGAANFLEMLLNDEEATLQQLNKLCGNESILSYTRVPRRRMPVEVAPAGTGPSSEAAGEDTWMNQENSIRSKILSHFIKGKVSMTPMETMLMIPGELEHLENLVKVARNKKDAEAVNNKVSMVLAAPTLRRICINKTQRRKTLHLSVEVNNYLVEGLVDTGASMSVMAATVVRELRLMHLVSGFETYKTASGVVTQALGQIDEVPVKKMNSATMVQEVVTVMANTHRNGKLDAIVRQPSLCEHNATRQTDACVSDSDSNTDEDRVGGLQLEELVTDESEFGNTELEDLVL
ncbi:unnamed protein product [Sphagnum jensenii]|uniref:Peptidase A2 domain-containing protein n=1 Tax=Sphagnum jensenii TaxID=128206 RepID=A0ABP1B235_9BRYO